MALLLQLLRAISGIAAAAALVVLLLIVFLHRAAALAKETAGVLGYVAALFTSGFTKGVAPERSAAWMVTPLQGLLALVFAGMIVTVFLPRNTAALHCVAALSFAAAGWYVRMYFTGPQLELLCLPALPVWFCYYALCLWGRR